MNCISGVKLHCERGLYSYCEGAQVLINFLIKSSHCFDPDDQQIALGVPLLVPVKWGRELTSRLCCLHCDQITSDDHTAHTLALDRNRTGAKISSL